MTAPRFEPKTMAATPAAFGKQASIVWKHPDDVEVPAHLFAAQWQHAYALAMRDEIAVKFDGALSAYARRAGCKYDRLTKILRGDQVMQSKDVGVAFSLLPRVHERAFRYLGASMDGQPADGVGAPTLQPPRERSTPVANPDQALRRRPVR